MKNDLSWYIKFFEDLTVEEFHDLLKLRIDVFVVEQNCPYPELDLKDKVSFHCFAKDSNEETVAVARILPEGVSYSEISIGRVAVAKKHRMQAIGHELMNECHSFVLKQFNTETIRISAQKYLESFYLSHGYISTGKEYLEDNIPHVEMLKTK